MNKKLVIAFIVFTAIGVGLFFILTMGNIGAKFNTAEVRIGELGKYVQDKGRIGSKNVRQYYGNGINRIESLPLKIGDSVDKGQLLVKYRDNLDLEIQKIQKQIEVLEASYENAQSGTAMENLSTARIEITKAKKSLEMATQSLTRTESLYSSGAVSLIELEQATNNVEQLKSSLQIAQNNYNRLAKGLSESIRKKYEAEIDVLLISLDILERNRENYAIYSDISGIVTELNTFEGDIPIMGTLMIEVQDPSEKVALVDFMMEDAIQISADMKAKIQDFDLGIHMDDLNVDRVYPKAFVTLSELGVRENRQTVEIGLPNSTEKLDFGMEVDALVMVEAPQKVLLIPIAAVFQEDSKQYVRVLSEGEAIQREITTGISMDGEIEVREGLDIGELVILNYEED